MTLRFEAQVVMESTEKLTSYMQVVNLTLLTTSRKDGREAEGGGLLN